MGQFVEMAAEAAAQVDPKSREYVLAARPCLDVSMRVLSFLVTVYLVLYTLLYKIYIRMPVNTLGMIFGAALCFFGGSYYASVAAIEAFRIFGWKSLVENLSIVAEQARLVAKASEEDDLVDDDKDGVADVDQLGARELLKRKTVLAMATVKEPERLQEACGQLWTAYVSVLATLHLQFARTTALALAIVGMCKFPILRLFLQPLMKFLGPETQHWAKTIIEVSIVHTRCPGRCSATENVHSRHPRISQPSSSCLSSSLMPPKNDIFHVLLRLGDFGPPRHPVSVVSSSCDLRLLLSHPGWQNRLPCYKEGFDADESYVDEIIAYSLAACGFFFQLTHGFMLPFPLDLILFPLTLVEYFLRWQVHLTSSSIGV
eukprot:scaffold84154_cov36-Tisochrysis_lutea.AAC.1